MGMLSDAVPVTGFTPNFSPIPRIAPPPLGREMEGRGLFAPSAPRSLASTSLRFSKRVNLRTGNIRKSYHGASRKGCQVNRAIAPTRLLFLVQLFSNMFHDCDVPIAQATVELVAEGGDVTFCDCFTGTASAHLPHYIPLHPRRAEFWRMSTAFHSLRRILPCRPKVSLSPFRLQVRSVGGFGARYELFTLKHFFRRRHY